MKHSFLLNFDKKWCGNNQVSAALLLGIAEEKTSDTLATLRLYLALCLFVEVLGFFFVTLGLSPYRPLWSFILGIVLMTGGSLLAAFFQNKSGIFLSLEFQKYLSKLNTSALEIRSFLADRGCTEQEINALQSLPNEVYQSELNGYQRSKILNIGAPLFCGLALLINQDIFTSILVIVLGLASFPIGEKFFKENTFRRESELRLGMAARVFQYVDKTYKKHLWLTAKVNFLSQLPLLLFAFKFIGSGNGQLLSSFFGLTQGLVGLTGTLSFQKARVATMKTTEMTSHLIHALSSPSLIISPHRWREHCSVKKNAYALSPQYRNGAYLKDFTPYLPFQDKEVFSLSCFIPTGSTCLLKAPSGKGKTTLLSALTHHIEHKGDFLFIKDQRIIDAHTLSREEFDSKIFYLKEENNEKSARLIDLFKDITFVKNRLFLEDFKIHVNPLLVDLAWKAPDNLIEQEIKNIESRRQSVFPKHTVDFLKELRKKQIEQIRSFCETAGGNLISDRIFPERNFSTLSSGEKRRITSLIALESCKALNNFYLVILDEPLTHLDKENIDYQLKTISEILKLPHPPAVLIISHHFIEEMREKLPNIQEIFV